MEQEVSDPTEKPPKKRKRTVISCTECHRRKQKCDRLLPCSSCVARGKQFLCFYEGGEQLELMHDIPISSESTQSEDTIPFDLSNQSRYYEFEQEPDSGSLTKGLGYSVHNRHNILGVLKKVEKATQNQPKHTITNPVDSERSELGQKYRDLVRQLPLSHYVDLLVRAFFTNVNWQYDILDEMSFKKQLSAWRNIPYSALQQGPQGVEPELRFFPGLLFQVLAQALLFMPLGSDETFDNLKYAPGMTFSDLAEGFSNTGEQILTLLGQLEPTVDAVQAGLLRASFLKCIGSVVEAWRMLGTSIRNAGDIGLHSNSFVGDDNQVSPPNFEESLWNEQTRRKLWFMLRLWDAHMAVILGRPMTTALRDDMFILPRDLQPRCENVRPTMRTNDDPPTPLTIILVGYHTVYRFLPKIYELQNTGARPEDYGVVEEITKTIMDRIDCLPPWCRVQGSDLSFDNLPSCYWLPAAREFLISEVFLTILSLHRPYVFSMRDSRSQALHAAIMVLRAQSRLSDIMKPYFEMGFIFVFSSFDSIVLTLSIYFLYPTEHRDRLESSLEMVDWGIDQLHAISTKNKMAEAAHTVARDLFTRLKTRLARFPDLHQTVTKDANQYRSQNAIGSNKTGGKGLRHDPITITDDVEVPTSTSDWSSITPPLAMNDLYFQNLGESYPDLTDLDLGHFPNSLLDSSFWNFIHNSELGDSYRLA